MNRPNLGRSSSSWQKDSSHRGIRNIPCGRKVDDNQLILRFLHEGEEVIHILCVSDHDVVCSCVCCVCFSFGRWWFLWLEEWSSVVVYHILGGTQPKSIQERDRQNGLGAMQDFRWESWTVDGGTETVLVRTYIRFHTYKQRRTVLPLTLQFWCLQIIYRWQRSEFQVEWYPSSTSIDRKERQRTLWASFLAWPLKSTHYR